ncbi:MAG: hypothetical protein SWX82_29475 [Cyanobacteriota bacterium]|nr:hypothetical protein [Cyanobacteriota bacterium]
MPYSQYWLIQYQEFSCNDFLQFYSYGNYLGFQLEIQGPCRIVYRPLKPASCGAHLWIDTFEPVQFVDTQFKPVMAKRAYKYV